MRACLRSVGPLVGLYCDVLLLTFVPYVNPHCSLILVLLVIEGSNIYVTRKDWRQVPLLLLHLQGILVSNSSTAMTHQSCELVFLPPQNKGWLDKKYVVVFRKRRNIRMKFPNRKWLLYSDSCKKKKLKKENSWVDSFLSVLLHEKLKLKQWC